MKRLLSSFAILVSFVGFNPSVTSAATSTNFEKLFYISSGSTEKEGIESLRKNINKIDIVAPQSYGISVESIPFGSVNPDVLSISKAAGKKIMPLIVNDGFRQDVIHNLLASSTGQDDVINFMITEAQKNNFIGWQFDIEQIFYTDRDAYTQFVKKSANALHAKGLQLSLAVVARTDDTKTSFYKKWSGAFDYAELSKYADFISVMTYDDPDSKGSAASLPYVKNVYAYLKDKIPAEKLSLGIPVYYWAWSVTPSKRIQTNGTYTQLQAIKSKYSSMEGYSDLYKVPYLLYTASTGKMNIVWFENQKSFTEKLNFAKANNLRGFSAWVLGSEDPSVWNAL